MTWDILTQIAVKIIRYAKENKWLVLFVTVFSFGVLFSAFCLKSGVFVGKDLSLPFSQFIGFRTQSFLEIFVGCIFSVVFPLFLFYCFGLFVYGYIPCFFLLFVQGMSYGAVSGYIYTTYGLKGVAFVLLVILPPAFCNTLVQFIASQQAFVFSVLLSKNYFRDTVLVQPSNYLKRYHYKFLVLLGFAFAVAFLDGLLSRVFINVFGF